MCSIYQSSVVFWGHKNELDFLISEHYSGWSYHLISKKKTEKNNWKKLLFIISVPCLKIKSYEKYGMPCTFSYRDFGQKSYFVWITFTVISPGRLELFLNFFQIQIAWISTKMLTYLTMCSWKWLNSAHTYW